MRYLGPVAYQEEGRSCGMDAPTRIIYYIIKDYP